MLAYAAAHCPWKEHTHQLRRGGELLTHVFLLMLHFGLSEQYEFTRFDGDEVSVLEFFSSVSIPKISLKYIAGCGLHFLFFILFNLKWLDDF